ncbi:unnamed protein product [Peronospora effusa]|nr:unnamed protein product [Peronospora effusa]
MRVYVQLLLAATAITHAATAKITTSVVVNTTDYTPESSSNAARDKGDGMMDVNVLGGIGEGLSKVAEKLKDVVKPNQDNLAAKAAASQVDPYETFLKVTGKLSKEKAIVELTKQLDERIVAQLIVRAKTDAIHKDAALKLEEAQMQYWLNNNKSGQDVFELLQLAKAKDDRLVPVDDLLAHPLFGYWMTYVERFNKDDSEKVSVIDFLKLKYNYSDVDLAHVVQDAKMDIVSRSNAFQVEEAQMKYWLKKGLTGNDMFKLLEMVEEKGTRLVPVDDLLTHPLFGYWITYVEKLNTKDSEKVSVVDILMSEYNYSDVDLARLIVDAKKGSTRNEDAKKLEEAQMEYWLKKDLSVDGVFKLLQMVEIKDGRLVPVDDLLTHPLFGYWMTYAERLNTKDSELVSVVDVLTPEYFSNAALAHLIVAAKKDLKPEVAKKLEKAQMKYWLNEKKSADDMFKLLEMVETKDDRLVPVDDLLAHPLFGYWMTYVEKLNTKDSKKLNVVDILTPKYYSDADLARLIVDAKMGPQHEVAKKVEKAQMEYWLNKKKSAYDVCHLLQLVKVEKSQLLFADDLLAQPLYHYWSTYVGRLLTQSNENAVSVVKMLTSKYSTEGLARLIVAAKKDLNHDDAVLKLEEAQMEYWLESEISAYHMFNLLGLAENNGKRFVPVDDLLAHPLFGYWMTYVERFNKDDSEKVSVIDFLKLKYNYSDVDLAHLIVHAKMGLQHEVAKKLEEAQMKFWLESEISAYDMFNLLQLSKAKDDRLVPVDDLLAHPLFGYWMTYVEKLDTNESKKEGVIDFFKTEFKYSDVDLARLIVHAKMGPQPEGAKKLEEAQMEYLLRTGVSADKLFKDMGLDTATGGILTHRLFNYWYTYFERINVEYNKNNKVIDFLRKKDTDNEIDSKVFLKDEVEKAKFVKRSDVDDLFMELRLDKVAKSLFSNELFIFWRTCLEKFEAAHPEEPRTSVFHLLRTVYDDKRLVDLIHAEQKGTDSANYASRLEKKLCETWVTKGKSLDDVFELLDLEAAGYKVLDDPSMEAFVTFMDAVNNIKKLHTGTKEAAFEENEIIRGIKFASSTGGLRSTRAEKALFQLWFIHKKKPDEIFKMFFGEDHLDKILKDEGNLFEIPLFITFMKYAEAYPRTKRLATAKDYKKQVTDIEKRPWMTDPITKVDYVERETNLAFLLQDQFANKFDKLVKMIVAAKESKKSMSAPYFAEKAEIDLWHLWTEKNTKKPNDIFEDLKLNAKMTPKDLFENPLFGWWVDYVEYLLTRISKSEIRYWDVLRKVFDSKSNLAWLKNARKKGDTKELADRVWKLLMHEHLIDTSSPKTFMKKMRLKLGKSDEKKWTDLLMKYSENEISAEDTKKEIMNLSDNDGDMVVLKEYTMKYINRHENAERKKRATAIVKSYEGPRKDEKDKLEFEEWKRRQELDRIKRRRRPKLKLEEEHEMEKKNEEEWKGESATAN